MEAIAEVPQDLLQAKCKGESGLHNFLINESKPMLIESVFFTESKESMQSQNHKVEASRCSFSLSFAMENLPYDTVFIFDGIILL